METTSPISAALDAIMERLIYECLSTYGTADTQSLERLLWLERRLKADRDHARVNALGFLNDVLGDIELSYAAGTILDSERDELTAQVHAAVHAHNERQFSRPPGDN